VKHTRHFSYSYS